MSKHNLHAFFAVLIFALIITALMLVGQCEAPASNQKTTVPTVSDFSFDFSKLVSHTFLRYDMYLISPEPISVVEMGLTYTVKDPFYLQINYLSNGDVASVGGMYYKRSGEWVVIVDGFWNKQLASVTMPYDAEKGGDVTTFNASLSNVSIGLQLQKDDLLFEFDSYIPITKMVFNTNQQETALVYGVEPAYGFSTTLGGKFSMYGYKHLIYLQGYRFFALNEPPAGMVFNEPLSGGKLGYGFYITDDIIFNISYGTTLNRSTNEMTPYCISVGLTYDGSMAGNGDDWKSPMFWRPDFFGINTAMKTGYGM